MAARAHSELEISLFPFLSIVLCIIGALLLLIIILSVVLGIAGDGRTPEEFNRAKEAVELQKQMASQESEMPAVTADLQKAQTLSSAAASRLQNLETQKDAKSLSAEDRRKAEERAKALLKELEKADVQLSFIDRERPKIANEIETIKGTLTAKKKALDTKPRVIVQPSSSGIAISDTKLFFVECNASGIVIYLGKGEPIRLNLAAIGTDASYDEFLKTAASTPKSMVLFLLRDDGIEAYNRAAGWAEGKFNVRTGKLPLIGQGEIDLSLFRNRP